VPDLYGPVWSNPIRDLQKIYDEKGSSDEALGDALRKGFFSQYTCWLNPEFNRKAVHWQLALLQKEFGDFWKKLPKTFQEYCRVPEQTCVDQEGRCLTPELLRNLYHGLEIEREMGKAEKIDAILEIGSGSGGLARICKDLFPQTQLWLLDLKESLTYAKLYIRKTFPNCQYLWLEKENGQNIPSNIDFVFVPSENLELIKGKKFSLAINIFSFGEMPNPSIQKYFSLLQEHCNLEKIYLVNGFLHPVTPETKDRANLGDWLFQLDSSWGILDFQVQPEIYRNPYVKNFPSCLQIIAKKNYSSHERETYLQEATGRLQDVLLQDWIGCLAAKIDNKSRPENESMIGGESFCSQNHILHLEQLLEVTGYIGRFELKKHKDPLLFPLWDCLRVTQSQLAAELLLCGLAMINKTCFASHCSKEELQILQRFPQLKTKEYYRRFF